MPQSLNEERMLFSSNTAGTTGYSHAKKKKKKEVGPLLHIFTKLTSRWIKHLNIKEHYKPIKKV